MLVVLPGIWKVSLLFYIATYIFDELREDSSALPTIYNYSYYSFNCSYERSGKKKFV